MSNKDWQISSQGSDSSVGLMICCKCKKEVKPVEFFRYYLDYSKDAYVLQCEDCCKDTPQVKQFKKNQYKKAERIKNIKTDLTKLIEKYNSDEEELTDLLESLSDKD